MAKRKRRPKAKPREGPPTALVRPAPLPPELSAAAEEQKKAEEQEPKYAFPTAVRCPRCSGVNTVALSTQGPVQYRACRHPLCRYHFKVVGNQV